jgi:ACDE family multidrug resistance protein
VPAAQNSEPSFRDILAIPEIRAAMLGTFVIMLGYGILAPVLPNYARSFGVGYGAVGVLVAAFSLTRLVFDPVVGRLIARFGERSMATLGAAGVGVSTALAAVAPNYPLLVVFRGAGGAGSAVFFAALLSFLLRTIPSDRIGRVMGVYYASFNVGIIAGQPFGGLLARAFGLASPLWVYAAACFVSAWMFHRTIADDAPRVADEARQVSLRRLPWDRPFVAVLASNGAYLWLTGALFGTLLPLFAREAVGLSLGGVGLALAVATLTEFAVLFPAGKTTDRRGRRAVLLPAFAAFAVVTALLGWADAPGTFVVALAALGVASGYAGVPPAPMLSDITPEGMSGPAVAAFRFVGDLGFVLGPLVAGWAAQRYGFGPAFAVTAVPCVAALLLVSSVPETRRPEPAGEAAGL